MLPDGPWAEWRVSDNKIAAALAGTVDPRSGKQDGGTSAEPYIYLKSLFA